MSDTDKKLKLMNDGRISALAVSHFGDLIEEMKTRELMKLTQNFRAGKIDHPTLLAGTAGICALEDLEREINRRIAKGEQAADQINKEQKQ